MFDETRLDSLLKQANDPSIVPDFSAAEVRRAGGRRRRRRYLATTATAVVVGLLSIGGIVALTRAAVSPTVAAPATPTLSVTPHETPSTPPLPSSPSQTPASTRESSCPPARSTRCSHSAWARRRRPGGRTAGLWSGTLP